MASCEGCDGECCRYITVTLKAPKDKEDWDEVKWMLLHKGVMIYKDLKNEWQVEVRTRCKHLDDANKCRIYCKRPKVCRDHELHECEAHGEEFAKVIFKKPKNVDEYLMKK